MTLIENTNQQKDPSDKEREESQASVMVRVMVPTRRANRFWQMLHDESRSHFVPLGTHVSDDFLSHRLMVVELSGDQENVNTDLDMFSKYHFTAKVVKNYDEAITIPSMAFVPTSKLDYSDAELDFNKKNSTTSSAFS